MNEKQVQLAKELFEAMEDFYIIDAHEHLMHESNRTGRVVDVFILFSHYTRFDLFGAGMSESDYRSLFDHRIPLDVRWNLFEPYWEQIRHTSYSRAALLAAKKFYGFEDINRQTYRALSEAIAANNTPGIYQRVLGDACRIKAALTIKWGTRDLESPLLVALRPMLYELETWDALAHPEFEPDATIRTLDDYLDAVRRYILRSKIQDKAVGLKMRSEPYKTPCREEALSAFNQLKNGTCDRLPRNNPLRDYVMDEAISYATELDMVIAVHTGYWGDFRELDPLHMIPVIQRHPNTRFDMFHLGYPWVRESLMLGKGFPNVWLNFCWTHIISQKFATEALDEALDLIPVSKISAFGGDYDLPVEKVYGHLVMAKEDVAAALSKRVINGQMTESQALDIARKWFWHNPRELYKLQV